MISLVYGDLFFYCVVYVGNDFFMKVGISVY